MHILCCICGVFSEQDCACVKFVAEKWLSDRLKLELMGVNMFFNIDLTPTVRPKAILFKE
jgi:hypothetical protein